MHYPNYSVFVLLRFCLFVEVLCIILISGGKKYFLGSSYDFFTKSCCLRLRLKKKK